MRTGNVSCISSQTSQSVDWKSLKKGHCREGSSGGYSADPEEGEQMAVKEALQSFIPPASAPWGS